MTSITPPLRVILALYTFKWSFAFPKKDRLESCHSWGSLCSAPYSCIPRQMVLWKFWVPGLIESKATFLNYFPYLSTAARINESWISCICDTCRILLVPFQIRWLLINVILPCVKGRDANCPFYSRWLEIQAESHNAHISRRTIV